MKYHINKATAQVGKCSATKMACPFGNIDEHFSSYAEAVKANERMLEEAHSSNPSLQTDGPSAKVALRQNVAVRKILTNLPLAERRTITGGYLDLKDAITHSPESKRAIDAFSEESDRQHEELLKTLEAMTLVKREDQTASLRLLELAEAQKEDGFKNEYVLAAIFAQYEGLAVHFPTGNIESGGKPKVDMLLEVNGKKYPLSVKKSNGTQIETYTSRATISTIAPGKEVVKRIEETSNRIFFFRPKYQAFAIKPGERERLRLLKDNTPKLAGASVRIEYSENSKIPAGRPTLPEESAVAAFGGVGQTQAMAIHDYDRKPSGVIAESSARIFVVGDFSKLEDLSSAPSVRDIFSESMAISRKGIQSKGLSVTLRVSSMGNRTGDWVTSKRHITDQGKVTLASYRKALKTFTN